MSRKRINPFVRVARVIRASAYRELCRSFGYVVIDSYGTRQYELDYSRAVSWLRYCSPAAVVLHRGSVVCGRAYSVGV